MIDGEAGQDRPSPNQVSTFLDAGNNSRFQEDGELRWEQFILQLVIQVN